jgi:hypothetical protein
LQRDCERAKQEQILVINGRIGRPVDATIVAQKDVHIHHNFANAGRRLFITYQIGGNVDSVHATLRRRRNLVGDMPQSVDERLLLASEWRVPDLFGSIQSRRYRFVGTTAAEGRKQARNPHPKRQNADTANGTTIWRIIGHNQASQTFWEVCGTQRRVA